MQLAETMWTPSTDYRPFHQVRQGLGKGVQSKHPVSSSPNAVARLARKALASQVETVRKRQWMSPAPPKNRKPPPAREPGPATNSFGKRQRGKGKRWDAKTEVRRFERRKPTRTGSPPPLSHSEVGAGGEGAGVFPLLAEGKHLAED